MKKFTTIFMTFIIMLMVVLTGCSTFRINKVEYYNEVLAKVGSENITRFDLVNAYNNYGYTNFVTQSGQSEKKALRSTMDSLIERKLVVNYAKENDKYDLSKYEVKKLYRETLDYLLESLASNKETARKIYNLEAPESNVTDPEDVEKYKLSEYRYEKRVKIENGQLKFIDTNTEKDEDMIDPSIDESYINNFEDYTDKQIINALLEKFIEEFYYNENDEDDVLYTKVCDKAIELTCNNLINYEYYLREDGKRLSTKSEDLLFRLVERAYTSQLENAYITKVSNVYLQETVLSNDSITNAYKAMYESDYAKYANDVDAYNSKITSTDAELIYYTPNSDAEFGYFLHVLLPFNNIEDDLNLLKEHKDMYTSDEAYKSAQMALIEQIMCAKRTTQDIYEDGELVFEEGVTLGESENIKDVLIEYNANVTDLNSFINFMFKYTTDNATLTADMPYIIGYDPATYTGELGDDDKLTGAYTAMVNNFTREAIRLMQEGQRYTKSNEYILTNYGIHLLYYVGPVSNQLEIQDISSVTVQDLDSAILNIATGETYLDRVFDLVYPAGSDGMFTSNTQYSDFERVLVDSLYAKYPVTLYKDKINASNKV